jgi:hypothetical protein
MYNLSETGVMTVVPAKHIVAQTGVKQVGQEVSGEKGQLITICTISNAKENTLPLAFVYLHVKMYDAQENQRTTTHLVNCPSGWMTGPIFFNCWSK